MHTVSSLFIGLITGIISTNIYINLNSASIQKNTGIKLQISLTEKIDSINNKIENLSQKIHQIDELKNSNLVTQNPTNQAKINIDNIEDADEIKTETENPLNNMRDKVNNEIASNSFNLIQLINSDELSSMTDKDKKQLISEIFNRVNSGQLPIDYVIKQ